MNVNVSTENKVCTIFVEGDVDTITSPELEKLVVENAPKCEKLVLDIAGVEYVSSAGIRVILKARQLMGNDNLLIRNMSENITEVFRITGFLKVLNVE